MARPDMTKDPGFPKVCQECNKNFNTPHRTQKFCTRTCLKKNYEKNLKKVDS